ncbi:MAG: hypothetical protein QOE26_462 [Verrucomicrobiota bacterium]
MPDFIDLLARFASTMGGHVQKFLEREKSFLRAFESQISLVRVSPHDLLWNSKLVANSNNCFVTVRTLIIVRGFLWVQHVAG